ncbi:MAG: hypothetical protein H6Q68_3978 [Firmicutes bacterium]|nr:hypothetical protein [Bacillota bacterium]
MRIQFDIHVSKNYHIEKLIQFNVLIFHKFDFYETLVFLK